MSIIEQTPQIEAPTISPEEEHRRDVLLRAAELIEERGYMSGPYGMTPDGAFCLMGAVGHAMGAYLVEDYAIMDIGPDGIVTNRVSVYGYSEVEEFLGVRPAGLDDMPWRWSDKQNEFPNPGERVAGALRKMANGASFEEATR